MRFRPAIGLAAAATLGLPALALAEATPIEVRVLSQGAKFIGSSMGGVRVTLRDSDTGALLASGLTRGGTGDTKTIMKTPQPRGAALSDESSAVFAAEIDIDRPRRVEMTATGPVAQRQAANTVSATRWVLPGVGVAGGDGWLVEMPGLMVDVLAPQAARKFDAPRETLRIEANVAMMCGCPLAPEDVPWDSDDYRVTAHVTLDGEPTGETELSHAGRRSLFAGELDASEPGLYEVTVAAHNPANGNAGVDHVTFQIPEPEAE